MERPPASAARPAIDQRLIVVIPVIYLLLAIAVTFPFAIHPQQTLTAPLCCDVAGSASKFQTLNAEHRSPFQVAHLVTVGYPAGITTQPGVDRVAFVNTAFLWLTSLLFGAVTAIGLLTILGYWLTALLTYLFVRRLTGSNEAGLVAGLAYGFFPHMYLMASAAPTYTHMWMLLLPIWGWFELAIKPTMRRGLLSGFAPVPAMVWTPYFALHVAVITAACLVVAGVWAALTKTLHRGVLLPAAVAIGIPIVAGAALFSVLALSHQSGVPARSVEDAFQESAHPLMFLIPGFGSIWGARPYELLVRLVPRAAFANLYIGITVLAMSLIAVATALSVVVRRRTSALASPFVLATAMASAIVLACFLFSLPPHLSGIGIPMPDLIVIKLQPAFRAGQRFVMPLMAGMAVLTGLGVSGILRRIASPLPALLVVVVIALAVGLDLFARHLDGVTLRPDAVETIPTSPALAMLGTQPPGPTFEFVDHTRVSSIANINPCLLQPQHHQTLVDTCNMGPGTSDYIRWDASRSCDSFSDMRDKGIRYVIVDRVMAALTACDLDAAAGPVQKIAADDLVVVFRLA